MTKTESFFFIPYAFLSGHFLLTELLLDLLKESETSRIIHTTASAQNLGNIDFDDINSEKKEYSLGDMYAQSKVAVVLHALQLADRLKGNCLFFWLIYIYISLCSLHYNIRPKSQEFTSYVLT